MSRVFVDTNVFLRFLTRDEPTQAARTRALFAAALRGDVTLETSLLVLAEIVWTLESYYALPRARVAELVATILETPHLECPARELLFEALPLYAERNVDFIDAYHGVWLGRQPQLSVATFDRKHFKRFPGVTFHEF